MHVRMLPVAFRIALYATSLAFGAVMNAKLASTSINCSAYARAIPASLTSVRSVPFQDQTAATGAWRATLLTELQAFATT